MFTYDNGLLSVFGPFQFRGINDIRFTAPGIKKQLDSLPTCKAAGPDGIPARILHDLSAKIAEILCFLFQQSYDSAHLPDDWLVAMIVPIHKKDEK